MALKTNIQVVGNERFNLGEGPHWDASRNKLFMVDLFVGDFVSIDFNNDDKVDKVHFDDVTTLIVPYANDDNKFIVSRNQTICELDWSTRELVELTTVESGQDTRFNDGKCDPRGRLWAGTMGNEVTPGVFPPEKGNLYSYSGQQLKHQVGSVTLSNGLDWSPDGKTMYFADSIKRQVYTFNFNGDDGSLSNQQVLFDYEGQAFPFSKHEIPDGMTVDATGKLWLASHDGGVILHIDPETGTLLDHIALPATRALLCASVGHT
ncbi:Regucalcin [Halotydeus destructor]|nr:Regucalcin [Halotydeus destructor]